MSIAAAAKEAATPKSKPRRPDVEAELNNLAMSKEAQPLFDAVKAHIAENVAPIIDEFMKLGEGRKDRWSWAPGQLELLDLFGRAGAALAAYRGKFAAWRAILAERDRVAETMRLAERLGAESLTLSSLVLTWLRF